MWGPIYQALYRKYRSRTFDEVCGQEQVTETLKAQVASGRLSHAYLFIGTRGTGKTSCAKILAKAVNCEHPVNGNPCCQCAACRGIDDGSVMDVVEIDAASNNGVDNIRALRDEAIFSPASVKKRVYIVDEVHMLSIAAFNALLKILEEPPEHLMFILATTELRKVPATILSRCQRYSFRRLDTEVISKHLDYIAAQEGFKLTHEASELLARLADGGMRDAISLLDQCSNSPVIDEATVLEATGLAGNRRVASLLSAIGKRDAGAALDIFASLWRDGKDPASLLSDLCALMRDVLLLDLAPKGGAPCSPAPTTTRPARLRPRFHPRGAAAEHAARPGGALFAQGQSLPADCGGDLPRHTLRPWHCRGSAGAGRARLTSGARRPASSRPFART